MKNFIRSRAGGYSTIQASCGAKALLTAGEAAGGDWSFHTFLLRSSDPSIFVHAYDASPPYLTDAEVQCYMDRYPDLQIGFQNSTSQKSLVDLMRYHWRTAGRAEGRNPQCNSSQIAAATAKLT